MSNNEIMYNFDSIVDPNVISEITDKKILFYDLNVATKLTFSWFQMKNIYVTGFVLSDEKSHLKDIHYMNKPMFSFDELDDLGKDFVIIDVSGKNVELLESKTDLSVYSLIKSLNPVIIFSNSDRYAQFASDISHHIGISIHKIICTSEFVGTNYEPSSTIEVMPNGIIRQQYFDFDVVVNINPKNDPRNRSGVDVAKALIEDRIFKSCRVFDPSQFFFTPEFGREDDVVVYPATVFYLSCKIKENVKMFLFGATQKIITCSKKFALLDMKIDTAISSDENFVGEIDGVKFISKYDLLYEQDGKYIVVALTDSLFKAIEFIRDNGLNYRNFVRIDSHECVYPVSIDPTLGYNLPGSYIVLNSYKSNRKIRVGITGGSTSDITAYPERTWVEYLKDIAETNGFEVEVYDGAFRAYIVSQEFMKFARDMSHLNLDIMLSYSGLNDCLFASFGNYIIAQNNPSIHSYQCALFTRIAKSGKLIKHWDYIEGTPAVSWGRGISNPVENWIHQELMMDAICEKLGIKFYSILQPHFMTKDLLTSMELSTFETVLLTGDFPRANTRRVSDLYDLKNMEDIASKMNAKNYPWFHDFLHILDDESDLYFDECHLFSRGNRIIAQHIFDLIKDDLIEISR